MRPAPPKRTCDGIVREKRRDDVGQFFDDFGICSFLWFALFFLLELIEAPVAHNLHSVRHFYVVSQTYDEF